MVLRPFGFSVENFSALAGLEVKLGQTRSQHGPDMVPKNRHSIEKVLREGRFQEYTPMHRSKASRLEPKN